MKILVTMMSALLISTMAWSTEDGKLNVSKSASKITWTGKKVTGEHSGTIKIKQGTLEIADGMLTSGRVSADMTSMDCTDEMSDEYKQKLIGHLKSPDFFDVASFPDASFNLNSMEKAPTGQYIVKGDLIIKGKSNPIEFPARVTMSDNSVVVDADVTFDRAKYDVQYGSGSFFEGLGDNLIYDEVTLSIHLEAGK